MRDFFRMAIRVVMVLFLVVGCVQNVYYLGELSKNANTYHGYNSSYRYNNTSKYIDADEIEEVEEDPVEYDAQEDEYSDYNQQTRPVTAY